MHQFDTKKADKQCKCFVVFSILLLVVAAFCIDTPIEILIGLKEIIISRDALITDYFVVGGYGATFVNVALVVLVEFLLLCYEKVKFTGVTLSVLYINVGLAFFGKNIVNILPIIAGTALYATFHHVRLNNFIYSALLGTCMSPFVTEMMYILPFEISMKVIVGILLGLVMGFILPPIAEQTFSIHRGYSLFNVGFSAGMIAFVIMCLLKSFGLYTEGVLVWKEDTPKVLIVGMFLFYISTFLYGLYLNKGSIDGLKDIMKHSGQAVTDFVLTDGVGATFMNMGTIGLIGAIYIVCIGGDFSGPVIGGIVSLFGFGAFGGHAKNYSIVLLGVFLSTFISKYDVTTPAIQLAALFVVGVAPIAGKFGIIAGIIAGILHSAIVTYTSSMYGGLNLYNNGFSCGWVAIILVPVLESFRIGLRGKD